MQQIIAPSAGLGGLIRVPGDRSITVRAVLLAAIADGTSEVRAPLACDDTDAAIDCMRALGAQIADETGPGGLRALRVIARGLHGLQAPAHDLFCGSSGTTMRLLAGLACGQRFASALDGTAQLRRRPMRRITSPLRDMGAQISDTDGCAPMHIAPAHLHAIDYAMPVASAQVKSAILLASLYAEGNTLVRETAPTRDHTERMLRGCGVDVRRSLDAAGRPSVAVVGRPAAIRPLRLTVPADFSSAAFFMTAAALVAGSAITLADVGMNDTRIGLLDALRAMGANITAGPLRDEGGEPVADLEVRASDLGGIDVSGHLSARMIDEFPVFAVAATQARGVTVVRDAEELRVKESNRLEGFVGELRKMGARIETTPDGFVVEGPSRLQGATVDGLGDHRVAMALAVAGLVAHGSTTILGADCVSKTYPDFFADLAVLQP